MFCPKCGKELSDAAVYCSACGVVVRRKVSAAGQERKPAVDNQTMVLAEAGQTQKPELATAPRKQGGGMNPKILASAAAFVVLAVVIVVAVGSSSANDGSASGSGSAASMKEYSGELGMLIALSNDELVGKLMVAGFTKSGDTYKKSDIEVDLDGEKGYRIITYKNPTLAYQLLKEEGPGFTELGAYFKSGEDSDFSVGITPIAGAKGIVVGSGGKSGCLIMVFEPGHFSNMKMVAKNVSFSDSMGADEAAKTFVEGLEANGYEHVDGDQLGKTSKTGESTSKNASSSAHSVAASSLSASTVTHDNVTGKVYCNGGKAPNAVNTVQISDNEIIIKGKLFSEGKDIGSKTWSFGLDGNTQYGAVSGQGYKDYPKNEMIRNWEAGNFPTLVLEVENGMVKKAYQQS